jgi:hypothetical protein
MSLMALGLMWAGLAHAARPACTVEGLSSPKPDAIQPVVWVSPLRKTVGNGRSIRVVPMAELRAAAQDGRFSVGRMLQILGIRKKARNPRRAWKVTVFEASTGALCRPIAEAEASDFVSGLPVCRPRHNRASRKDTGCGTTRDRANDGKGLEMVRATWRDLAPQGFCVLPAERFVAELTR